MDHSLFLENSSASDHDQKHCPHCQSSLTIKSSKHGAFLACCNYPACRYIKPLTPHTGDIIKQLEIACPKCQSALVLRQGRFGMFIGCSAYPACHHIESRHEHEQSETAKYSVGCPKCGKGKLSEKQSRFGRTFYACDQYPACRFTVNLKPISASCIACRTPLLLERTDQKKKKIAYMCSQKGCQFNE